MSDSTNMGDLIDNLANQINDNDKSKLLKSNYCYESNEYHIKAIYIINLKIDRMMIMIMMMIIMTMIMIMMMIIMTMIMMMIMMMMMMKIIMTIMILMTIPTLMDI